MRVLAPKTVELYRSELHCHILPTLDGVRLGDITTEGVRLWHSALVQATSAIGAAKCYRRLRAICATAVEDELLERNPCRVKGAGRERSRERPLLTTDQVLDIADGIDPRYRALVTLAAYGSLRRGELLGLRRSSVDPVSARVTITGQAQRITGRGRVIRDPKSDAGLRTVAVPSVVMSALIAHMATYTGSDPGAWVFTADKGGPAREDHLRAAWDRAADECGVPEAHLHDLRHFGATLAAQLGATTRELQSRLGHFARCDIALLPVVDTRTFTVLEVPALRSKKRRWDHGNPVGPSVRLRPGCDDRRVDQLRSQLASQPDEVVHVAVRDACGELYLHSDDPPISSLDDEIDFAVTAPCAHVLDPGPVRLGEHAEIERHQRFEQGAEQRAVTGNRRSHVGAVQ